MSFIGGVFFFFYGWNSLKYFVVFECVFYLKENECNLIILKYIDVG